MSDADDQHIPPSVTGTDDQGTGSGYVNGFLSSGFFFYNFKVKTNKSIATVRVLPGHLRFD